jgi:2-polyprenyl-3-methyl-5-hydroxy-6-metoxy-1,4-benzoquinol methylase
MTGRHRIAALRYLRSQGKMRNKKIRCHIVDYPYESLIYTRPYTESCKNCNWGEIYDPGKGTHQDFFIREGIAMLRGHPRKKGGAQKWKLISPIFKKMVNKKSILDVGAHRGLYCIKALEYGSKEATALDPNEGHISTLTEIKDQYYLQDFSVIKGDFYEENDYKKLYKTKYDTVFFFGIIHHLLRIGIQKNILSSFDELLERISDITNYGVIIEFAMPRERDFLLTELRQYENNFTIKEFERSLKNYFPNYQNLGRCEYTSGNRFGRFMFCATK